MLTISRKLFLISMVSLIWILFVCILNNHSLNLDLEWLDFLGHLSWGFLACRHFLWNISCNVLQCILHWTFLQEFILYNIDNRGGCLKILICINYLIIQELDCDKMYKIRPVNSCRDSEIHIDPLSVLN